MQSYQNKCDNKDEGINFGAKGIKCGEIFTTQNEIFSVLCTFCGTILKDVVGFTIHFKTNHNNQFKDELEIKVEELPIIDTLTDPIGQNRIETINTSHVEILENFKDCVETDNNFSCESETEPDEAVGDTTKIRKNFNKSSSIHSDDSSEKSESKCNKNKAKIKTRKKTSKSCNKELTTEATLKRHTISDHSVSLRSGSSEENTKQVKSSLPQNLIQTVDGRLMKCRFCYRKFKVLKRLSEHEYSHTGEKPHKCNLCEKKFRTSKGLKEHLRCHENKREFKCEICGVGYNCKATLKVHIRRHNSDRPFKCDYCNKGFLNNATKKLHENVHTGIKRFVCSMCGDSFHTNSHLIVHTRRKHTGEKPFKCKYCDKEFVAHITKKEHETTHTGEKPFTCDVCGKKFSLSKYLKDHLKLHSDVLGYVCHICGKGFKQSSVLRHHRKTHGIPLKNNI